VSRTLPRNAKKERKKENVLIDFWFSQTWQLEMEKFLPQKSSLTLTQSEE
jgi:hypothetical protein